MTDQTIVNTLVQKLAVASAQVGGKLKADKTNKEQNYAYISADKILSECGQALSNQGIAIIPSVVKQEITLFEYTDAYGKAKKRYDCVADMIFKVTDGVTEYNENWFGMGSDYSVPDSRFTRPSPAGINTFLPNCFVSVRATRTANMMNQRSPRPRMDRPNRSRRPSIPRPPKP